MLRVMFVDDEAQVLAGLRLSLRSLRNEWQMTFIEGGKLALAHLAKNSVDVVVSDMRMPGMDGSQLLSEVKKHWPETIRIILSGQTETEVAVGAIPVSHQFLSKPITQEELKATLARVSQTQALLRDDTLRARVAKMKMVPPMPKSMVAIDRAMQDPHSDLKSLAATIEQDASLASRVLQIVNSSYFGIARKVNDVQHAVTLLGVLTLRSVVMALESSRSFAGRGGLSVEVQESVQRYCGFVATLCRHIFSSERLKAENAFTAGLLHEMGFMLLRANDEPLAESEVENPSVGAFLLGNWGLCHPVVEAVAFQDTPGLLGHVRLEPADGLAIARQLLAESGCSPPTGPLPSALDGAFFDARGVTESQLSSWRARAGQIASGGAT